MRYLKERTLEGLNYKAVSQLIALTGVVVFLPFIIHIQWFTGPIMNAIFILVLFLFGIRSAIIVALVPSLMALSGGLLPPILAPAVPFIMLSNVLFIFSIDFFYNKLKNPHWGYWSGVIIGSGLKFLFLYLSIIWIEKLILKESLIIKIAQMMSWPQFGTALAGGILAFGVLKFLRRI